MANRNQCFGNEEERYGSTVLRTNWRSGASGNQSHHGNTMTSETSNSSGEEMQEADENQSVTPEDRSRDPRYMSSPNANRNGNGKGQPNLKYLRKTEYCGTHTRKTQEKGVSTNNNFECGQEKNTISAKSPQRDSNKEVSKNKNIMSLQSEMNSSKDNSKYESNTIPKVVNDFIEEVYNGKDVVDSTKKASKHTDIANFQSMSVSLKENNSICKGTISSQVAPVDSGENKESVGDYNLNSSKSSKIQPVEINDNKCNVFQSAAKHFSPDNDKKLQEINKRYSNRKNIAADENVIAKRYGVEGEDLSVDENVAEDENIQVVKNVAVNKSISTAGTVAKHSFPGNDKELQGINNRKLDHENFAVVEADDTVATDESDAAAGTVAEHSSPGNNKESQEINKCKLDQEIIESSIRSPYPNSLCIVPDIANTVPKVLDTDREVSISDFFGKNSANEKLLECLISSVPLPSNFEANSYKIELEPKQDYSAPGVFGLVPTVSNSILETSVSKPNEALPTKSRETLSSAKTNPFDEKPLIPKPLMASSVLQYSNSEAFNTKTDVEMKQLTPMQSMKSNQSIYKLAYNESITSSETNSRSLSPVDPESQVPSSIVNDEIIVHEADTDSDAGSEDVELIPHRYECETSLNRNRNVYVNKLSLAVELLRTQESLPYDDHFKRVVEDNDPSAEDAVGEVNFGFEEESSSFDTSKVQVREVVVSSPSTSNKLTVNSGASSSVVNEDGFNDSCEEAQEITLGTSIKNKDATKEVKAANRRYQVHFRHYFSPRAMANPCLCCVIM